MPPPCVGELGSTNALQKRCYEILLVRRRYRLSRPCWLRAVAAVVDREALPPHPRRPPPLNCWWVYRSPATRASTERERTPDSTRRPASSPTPPGCSM